ncbi:TPA: hypothetical protein QCY12_003981 [Bacillus cytotoxicus]|nr:hypothetical protein [Bacillus cytotoxicus]
MTTMYGHEVTMELCDAICNDIAQYQTLITLLTGKMKKEDVLEIVNLMKTVDFTDKRFKSWLEDFVKTWCEPRWDREEDNNEQG